MFEEKLAEFLLHFQTQIFEKGCGKLALHIYNALTDPRILHGLATTADSATALCSSNALSTSNGPIR